MSLNASPSKRGKPAKPSADAKPTGPAPAPVAPFVSEPPPPPAKLEPKPLEAAPDGVSPTGKYKVIFGRVRVNADQLADVGDILALSDDEARHLLGHKVITAYLSHD